MLLGMGKDNRWEEKSEGRSQSAEVRSEKSEVRSQNAEVKVGSLGFTFAF
jgi:hypothetical protein